jgi:tetratricopeptide (TPR) repeat protein
MAKNPEYSYQKHRVYGRVRLRRRSRVELDGRTYEWWEYDPTFVPETPAYAVPGDPFKQVFCPAHQIPKYFYLDEGRACVQCGNDFVFTANEQRFWYETLKFNIDTVAIRCTRCRRGRRQQRAVNAQVAAARAAVALTPESPTGYLDLAESLVRLHQLTQRGNLDDAIAAARKARTLWPEGLEADFWEGMAHHLEGRVGRAEALLRNFVKQPRSAANRRQSLAREAHQILSGYE